MKTMIVQCANCGPQIILIKHDGQKVMKQCPTCGAVRTLGEEWREVK